MLSLCGSSSSGQAPPGSSALAPPTVAVDPEPSDDVFTGLAVRRSTLDWVPRRTVAAEPGHECRFGVRVRGLVADGAPVTGVRTNGVEIHADMVVDASGRRTRIDAWLIELGLPATDLVEGAEHGGRGLLLD